jgi:hypothetical protein
VVTVVVVFVLGCCRVSVLVKRRGRYSGYRGVSVKRGRWLAQIRHGGKLEYLGVYGSERAAAEAYDRRARELLGVDARLNFGR